MTIAFFDFDNTITKTDSFLDFIKYAKGKKALRKFFILKCFSLVGYKLGLVPGKTMKEIAISYFFKEKEETELKNLGQEYVANRLTTILKTVAIDKLNWHRSNNHKIVIVTASLSYWIEPWCVQNKYGLMATNIDILDDRITGRLNGANNNYNEKSRRIREMFDLKDYEYIYAYGDSKGDRAMLDLATHKFYRKF